MKLLLSLLVLSVPLANLEILEHFHVEHASIGVSHSSHNNHNDQGHHHHSADESQKHNQADHKHQLISLDGFLLATSGNVFSNIVVKSLGNYFIELKPQKLIKYRMVSFWRRHKFVIPPPERYRNLPLII